MKKLNYILLSFVFIGALSCVNDDEINQARPGFSAGTPRLDLKVVDSEGNAVAGASVDFFNNADDYVNELNSVKTATTDANGIASLMPGDVSSEIGRYFFSVSSGTSRNWTDVVGTPVLYWGAGPTVIKTVVAPVFPQFIDIIANDWIMTSYTNGAGENTLGANPCEDDDVFRFRKDGNIVRFEAASVCDMPRADQAPVSVAGEVWGTWALSDAGATITLRDLDPAWENGNVDAGLVTSATTVTIDYGGGFIATLEAK